MIYLQDASQKKRLQGSARQGIKNGQHKLTDDAVRAIRSSTERTSILTERYGVSATLVRDLRRGERWAHVQNA